MAVLNGAGAGDRLPSGVEVRLPISEGKPGRRGQRRCEQDAGRRGRARAGGVDGLCLDDHLAMRRRLAGSAERERVAVNAGRADLGVHGFALHSFALHGDVVGKFASADPPVHLDHRPRRTPEAIRLDLEPQRLRRPREPARRDRRRPSRQHRAENPPSHWG